MEQVAIPDTSRIRSSRLLAWRAALLIEFAAIYWYAWTTAGVIGFQLRNDGRYPMGCTSIDLLSTLLEFLVIALMLAIIIMLLRFRSWSRYAHLLITLLLIYATGELLVMAFTDPPFVFSTPYFVVVTAASIFASLTSFTTLRAHFRPPARQ